MEPNCHVCGKTVFVGYEVRDDLGGRRLYHGDCIRQPIEGTWRPVGEAKKPPYSPPKLTEYPMTGAMHKAAIEAAKHEATCEMLDLVVDAVVELDALTKQHGWDYKTQLLELFRTWQQIHEEGKRKALDHFVELVQEKLRSDVALTSRIGRV